MAAVHNLLGKGRVLLDGLTDHVRAHLDADPVPQVEQARNAFLETIVVPFLYGQVRVFRIKRWKGTTGSSFGLSACFELHGNRDDEPCFLRPKTLSRCRPGFFFLLGITTCSRACDAASSIRAATSFGLET